MNGVSFITSSLNVSVALAKLLKTLHTSPAKRVIAAFDPGFITLYKNGDKHLFQKISMSRFIKKEIIIYYKTLKEGCLSLL